MGLKQVMWQKQISVKDDIINYEHIKVKIKFDMKSGDTLYDKAYLVIKQLMVSPNSVPRQGTFNAIILNLIVQ